MRRSGIEGDTRPLLMVGLTPFSEVPEHMAERLDRNMMFVVMNNVVVYNIYYS